MSICLSHPIILAIIHPTIFYWSCYTPHFNEVERGVYWFHLVRLWTESCLLSIFNNTNRIHYIFAHLIKQLQKVKFVSIFKNLKLWQILHICNFDFVFCWLGIQYDSIVSVIMRRQGYPDNAGVLVVLVHIWCNTNLSIKDILCSFSVLLWHFEILCLVFYSRFFTILQPIIFHESCLYLVHRLNVVGTWPLLLMGSLCPFLGILKYYYTTKVE